MAITSSDVDEAASVFLQLTSGASANTFGSYVELIASSSHATNWVFVEAYAYNTNSTRSSLIQIVSGPVLSEVALFEFMLQHSSASMAGRISFMIPCEIAASSRISARAKGLSGSNVVGVKVTLIEDASRGTASANELLKGATTKGIVIDPGAVAHTKGAWTEMVASTAHDYEYIALFLGTDVNATMGVVTTWLIDIAVGAAASEVAVFENIYYSADINELATPTVISMWAQNIPIGSRVSIRAQCSNTDATDRLIMASILGVAVTAPAGGGGSTSISGYGD